VKLRIILLAVAACVVIGLAACGRSKPPPPTTIDAPRLASSFKWLGVCGVICSALGATGLIIASRNHLNRGRK
jgi:hypothetical protein